MINEPLRLTVEEVSILNPTIFSVQYGSTVYKNYWYVDLTVESGQVFLCDKAQKPLQFDSEEEATSFCNGHWPDAVQAKYSLGFIK